MKYEIQINNMFKDDVHFDIVKPYVFAFPFDEGGCDLLEDDGCPVFESYGGLWQFVLQDPMDSWYMKSITNKMVDEWGISKNALLETSKANIRVYLPLASYQVLYGNVSNTVIPFMAVYLKDKSRVPPFGSSMILLQEVDERIYQCMGNFCAFAADMETIFALPADYLMQCSLDPLECFHAIMQDELKPMISNEEPLFPEMENNEIVTQYPINMGVW